MQRRSDIEKLESRIMLQGVVFDSHVDYGVGDDPLGIAVGDFNGDGKLDLAVPNRTDDNVSVLLGNGDGTFQSTNEFGAGYYPDAVTVGDFAGDGVLDLVTANSLGSAIGVLVGNGDGTFQPQLRQQVGCMPESVAVGDLNNDGMPDIVAANFADSTVSVLMDQGVVSGTLSFAPQAVYPVGPAGVTMQPSSVAVADLTGNGINDIITADLKIGEISVLMGNGDGTFQAPITFKCGNDPESVVVADLNGDGIPDIITADSVDRSVDVLLGKGMRNGALKFKPAEALYLGDRPRYSPLAVAVGDFNGDGIEDIAVAEGGVSYVSGYTVAVLLGNGNGTFQAPVVLNVGYQPTAIAVGDFTGDGRPDIAVSDSGASEISVLINETPIIQNIGGTLTVLGTNNADTATVTERNGKLIANLDGTIDKFAESSVASIILNMGGGNDSVTIGPGVPEVLVDGGGGNDSIVAQNHAPNTLMGGNGNDTIIGGGGPELLEGGTGNDSIIGGIGADSLIGGAGNDTLVAGPGLDSIDGSGGGNDEITAPSGLDTVIGATGSSGRDTILAGSGDSIDAGPRDVVNLSTAPEVFSDEIVSAMSNIYGAGQSAPPDPGGNGGGNLPPMFNLPGNPSLLTFSSVTGQISLNNGFDGEFNDPDDGGTSSNYGYPVGSYAALDGLSGITAPGVGWLAGVFESNSAPANPAPPSLDFTSIGTDFTSLAPELNQIFFIGDGLTDDGTGSVQRFDIPAGATRLYLGVADGNASSPKSVGFFSDNSGNFTATFQVVSS